MAAPVFETILGSGNGKNKGQGEDGGGGGEDAELGDLIECYED